MAIQPTMIQRTIQRTTRITTRLMVVSVARAETLTMDRALCESTVIVSGLPRSGTSMMMQMLSAGGLPVLADGIRAADEDNPRGYFEFEQVKQTKRDPSWLDQATGKVVKMVHVLLQDLPTDRPYRVILMRRKMEEVLKSQTAMLARSGKEGAALPADKLASIFEKQMEKVVATMHELDCFRLLEVSYDSVLARPLAEAEVINDFLDGALETSAMASVVDPQLYRQRS